MSNPTTSLDFSRKLFEIIGKQKTYQFYSDCPAYTFGELLRVIPLIYEKANIKNYYLSEVIGWCAEKYVTATTPEQGMREVEAYLETMI